MSYTRATSWFLVIAVGIVLALIPRPAVAGGGRVSLGMLPFASSGHGRQTFAHVVPGLIGYGLYFIPRIDQADMRDLVSCMQMDRLSRPRSLADSRGYSRLAKDLGVDYLATGTVYRRRDSGLRVDVVLYSASDPKARRRFRFDASPAELPQAASRAATNIAALMGVSVQKRVSIAPRRMSLNGLESMDRALRIQCRSDADAAEIATATRLVHAIESINGSPDALCMVYLGYHPWSPLRAIGIRSIPGTPTNLFLLSAIVREHLRAGSTGLAEIYIECWNHLDPTSPLARIAALESLRLRRTRGVVGGSEAGGPPVLGVSGWQLDLAAAEFYGVGRDVDRLNALVGRLEAEHPRSAYLRAVVGSIYVDINRYPEGAALFREAVDLNPNSFRLHLLLAQALKMVDSDEALQVLRRVLKRWPGHSEAHMLAASVYIKRGEHRKAVKELEMARKLEPGTQLNRELAAQYMKSGRVVEAVRELARGESDIRRFLIVVASVLTGIFLLGVIGVAFLIRCALASERSRRCKAKRPEH